MYIMKKVDVTDKVQLLQIPKDTRGIIMEILQRELSWHDLATAGNSLKEEPCASPQSW